MASLPRSLLRLLTVTAIGLLPGFQFFFEGPVVPPAQAQEPPQTAFCEDDHAFPYLDSAKIRQEYKHFPDPKPKVFKPRPMDMATVNEAVRDFVAAELSDRKCRPSSGDCLRAGDKWLCTYRLDYEGIPLSRTTDVMCILHHDGHALVFRERNLPHKVDAIKATVKAKNAIEAGREDFRKRGEEPAAEATDPALEIWVDGERDGHLCWTFIVGNGSVAKARAVRYWVAAVGMPRIVALENLIHQHHAGTVTGTVWPTTPLQPTRRLPLPSMDVMCGKVRGGGRPTGPAGEYAFVPTSGRANIRATLIGPACKIEDHSGRPLLKRTHAGDGAGPFNLEFSTKDELEIAQLTAFYWVGVGREFAKDVLSPSHLWQLKTRVNIDATCNAGFSGADVSINFFQAGKGCLNTAYSDIVLHEYGHAIDFIHGGILNAGYSEGFGDAFAILVTRQPRVGRDLHGPGSSLRDARKVVTFPVKNSEPHFVGQIYAGFVWELIQQLERHSRHHSGEDAFEIAKRLILAADAMNPKDIPDAVWLAFLADDDDGDLTNGSPHFAELAAAADSRKIPRPPDPVRVSGPRYAYHGPRGTHHLVAESGTASYVWHGDHRLASLKLEKTDADYWYYCEKERPQHRWAFALKGNSCGQFAVWFLPADASPTAWINFHEARRSAPDASEHRK